MEGYTKLFGSIVASTIWRADDATRIVWITMLAIKNSDGVVEASVPGLADLARKTIAETEHALDFLLRADPYSRSQEFDGRRIEAIDGGWLILNADKYRDKSSGDDRRAKEAARQQRRRDRLKARTHPSVTSVTEPIYPQKNEKQPTRDESPAESIEGIGTAASRDVRTQKRDSSRLVRNVTPSDQIRTDQIRSKPQSSDARAHVRTSEPGPDPGIEPESPPAVVAWPMRWLQAFGAEWCRRRSRLSYGKGEADARALARFGAELSAMHPDERLDAWGLRDRILAAYFTDTDRATVKGDHAFAFFTPRFGALYQAARKAPDLQPRCCAFHVQHPNRPIPEADQDVQCPLCQRLGVIPLEGWPCRPHAMDEAASVEVRDPDCPICKTQTPEVVAT